MFDFPKDVEWKLFKNIEQGKSEYKFAAWYTSPTISIAYFHTKTPKTMANKIKKLIKGLNKCTSKK